MSEHVPIVSQGLHWDGPSTPFRVQECFQSTTFVSASNACPCPHSDAVAGQTDFIPHNYTSSLALAAFTLVLSCMSTRGARVGAQCGLGHVVRRSWEASQSPRQFQAAFPILLRGVSKCMHALHEWSLGFLEPSF